ncbi:hypothetical protein M409DRAFT_48731 [Zasmidium cellare ATCC 36951]|uniref:Cytochrome P450 n=1 Tax=Zasmidium cellare ATCC 36951 TaxID=1080233 RepID=A0A6A6D6M2_ZASCE|nr:uncharacterized protein M409DRAFT_48731 [Zasmidium cellare ATCC 36951]KAF2173809.1 hypothetical protein M409DRAFT_48731 [Zasmidium cellare ATCC 36951]
MVPYLTLAIVAIAVAYVVHTYRCFQVNLAAAKKSGIPYVCTPVYTFNTVWLITHRLWMPFIEILPRSWTEEYIELLVPEFLWNQKHEIFKKYNSDVLIIVAPGANTLYVADADVISQITARRNDFPKPVWMYKGIDVYGKNVVSTEGANWRHHRKITSPPFTEKNNVLVWKESLRQAESMMAGWTTKDAEVSSPVWSVATEAMRLSLHVISRAGFGVGLFWPHEKSDTEIPSGHKMSYKGALETLLHNLIIMILTPQWILKYSPLKMHKVAYQSFCEWGQYMREMYNDKRAEVKSGASRDGMDLMGALVKGAGMTEESLNDTDAEKGGSQLLTDDEILGNAFVFILAGHETAANTIHFSMLFLAMHMKSQKRLQEDLDSILGDKPATEWDYDRDMPRLFGSMGGAVMNEQLRILPPVIGIPKTTPKDQPQGLIYEGRNITVPGSCYVTLATAATHRNPKYWSHTSEEDLVDFRPERWLLDPSKENSNSEANTYEEEEGLDFDGPDKRPDTAASPFRPPKGSYVPFSEGYRSCLGRRFAQVEILAVLAIVFKTWTVELDVSEYLSDEEFKTATPELRQEAWNKANERAKDLLENGMMTIITLQMRKGKVPFRFVKRGCERFKA